MEQHQSDQTHYLRSDHRNCFGTYFPTGDRNLHSRRSVRRSTSRNRTASCILPDYEFPLPHGKRPDIDGFYNCDPRLHPDAKLIEEIDKIDDEVYKLAGGAGSRRGTGGMRTKLQAAALATSQGIDTIITNGKNPAALYNIIEGVPVGTKFKAQ